MAISDDYEICKHWNHIKRCQAFNLGLELIPSHSKARDCGHPNIVNPS